MERPADYAPLGKKLPWRLLVEQQVRRLARHVMGEERYETYRMEP
jgi:CRISPR/Cas system-associated endonuclease Cas1